MNVRWLGIWRLGALLAAAALLHIAERRVAPPRAIQPPSLDQARRLFPAARALSDAGSGPGQVAVLDADGRVLGQILATSPEADDVVGYTGPNRVRIGLDPEGRIAGLQLVESGDTPSHAAAVERATNFWSQFIGWHPRREAAPTIQGVSGSTLTSLGIAEAIERRVAGRTLSLRFPEPVGVDEVRAVLPTAAVLKPEAGRPGWLEILDAAGRRIGRAIRSSPFAESVRGHGGPTEALAILDADGLRLRAVRLRRSYDTPEYVERVRDDDTFLSSLTRWTPQEWADLDFKKAGVEGVSGATETSYAVAEGLRRRFAAERTSGSAGNGTGFEWRWPDAVLALVVAGGVFMTFGRGRGRKRVRLAWQIVVVGVFGAWGANLLSLALFDGWARNGTPWKTAPALVLLAAAAVLVPWSTSRQTYCHQLCPHGVLQTWLAGRTWRLRLGNRLERGLSLLPAVLIAVALLSAAAGGGWNLAKLEPFDAWTRTGLATMSGVIAVAGLALAAFVPMGYCRFGCPTGAVLRFVRRRGPEDRFGHGDILALAILLAGTCVVLLRQDAGPRVLPKLPPAETIALEGRAFGTSWSVKIRGSVADPARLEGTAASELERIESGLSHWRTNSATWQFNHSSTTLAIEMPAEFRELLALALEISRQSGGAFDPTVAPLVRAWGFGPGDSKAPPPSDADLDSMRRRVGWDKVNVDDSSGTVRKSHPDLELDFGAILQGYAADRLGRLLAESGCTNFLIDVGGEMLARGTWQVGIEDPLNRGGILRRVELRDAALATSGTYRTRRSDGGVSRSHLIDPSTGRSVNHDTILTSVVHGSCARADAWATALLVRGWRDAPGLAARHGASVLSLHGIGGEGMVELSKEFPWIPESRSTHRSQ